MKLEENLKGSSIICLMLLVWTEWLFVRCFWACGWPNEAVSLVNNFQEDKFGPQVPEPKNMGSAEPRP